MLQLLSVYHYKTNDVRLLERGKYLEIKRNQLFQPARWLLWFDAFYGDFGIIQKAV